MKVYEMTIADIASEIFDKGEDFAEKIFNDIDELEKNKFLEINKLKQQLAEKDTRIEELEGQFAYECECNKQLVDLQKQLAEKDKEINSLIVDYEKRISQEQELMSNMEHRLTEKQNTIDEINKEFVQAVHDWKALCAEKDKEIEDLKEWQDWYSMWHKKFQKQIEDLTTELEIYRPTKLHGNGQCECFKCKQEGRRAIEWTDWCSRYKGHTYCNDCLKEVLKEEQTPQTQLAIQELEKLRDKVVESSEKIVDTVECIQDFHSGITLGRFKRIIDNQIKELKEEKDVKD